MKAARKDKRKVEMMVAWKVDNWAEKMVAQTVGLLVELLVGLMVGGMVVPWVVGKVDQ